MSVAWVVDWSTCSSLDPITVCSHLTWQKHTICIIAVTTMEEVNRGFRVRVYIICKTLKSCTDTCTMKLKWKHKIYGCLEFTMEVQVLEINVSFQIPAIWYTEQARTWLACNIKPCYRATLLSTFFYGSGSLIAFKCEPCCLNYFCCKTKISCGYNRD